MNRWMKSFKNRSGFTLTEMLIAVAVISLMGLVVIQVFITASSLNHKAADTDKAVAACSAVVEQFKGMPVSTVLDQSVMETAFPDASVKMKAEGREATMELNYTEDWVPVDQEAAKEAAFVLKAEFKTAPPEDGSVTLVAVSMTKMNRYFHKADAKPVLFTLEAALPQHLKGGVPQ